MLLDHSVQDFGESERLHQEMDTSSSIEVPTTYTMRLPTTMDGLGER